MAYQICKSLGFAQMLGMGEGGGGGGVAAPRARAASVARGGGGGDEGSSPAIAKECGGSA